MGHREGRLRYCKYCVELYWVTAVSSATMLTCNWRISKGRGLLCHYADLELTERALRGGTSGTAHTKGNWKRRPAILCHYADDELTDVAAPWHPLPL